MPCQATFGRLVVALVPGTHPPKNAACDERCVGLTDRRTRYCESMTYRNKTYVAFASEDIASYRMMEAWRANQHIEFDFFNAHTLYVARDTSKPETIKRNLRERMKNAKQVVLLGSPVAKRKGGDGASFLAYELGVAIEFDLPIVVAHLDGSRKGNSINYPKLLAGADYHTMSVSFQAKIIKYALDNYAANYATSETRGERIYSESVYTGLGL